MVYIEDPTVTTLSSYNLSPLESIAGVIILAFTIVIEAINKGA